MVSPLFQVTSMERLLSTPFNLAHTLAAERAVLFSPNSMILYKLLSSFMIRPRLMSAVLAIMIYELRIVSYDFEAAKLSQNGHSTKIGVFTRKQYQTAAVHAWAF